MSVNLNRVILAGNLTREPDMRFIPSGTAVTNLGLAVNRQYTGKDGGEKKETAFVTIVVWGKQAQNCQEYLHKGSPVLVEGRLQSRSWEDSEKKKRSTLEVVAERVHFLQGRREERGGVGEDNILSRKEEGGAIGEENVEYEPEGQETGPQE